MRGCVELYLGNTKIEHRNKQLLSRSVLVAVMTCSLLHSGNIQNIISMTSINLKFIIIIYFLFQHKIFGKYSFPIPNIYLVYKVLSKTSKIH